MLALRYAGDIHRTHAGPIVDKFIIVLILL